MFDTFRQKFVRDPWGLSPLPEAIKVDDPDLQALFDQFGGASFNGGLYRVIHSSELEIWNDRVSEAFPDLRGQIACFGYDWLGNAFLQSKWEEIDGKPTITVVDISEGAMYAIPGNVISCHEEQLVNRYDLWLITEFYEDWIKNGGDVPKYNECIGCKVPMFLGGSQVVENMEISDIDVYWSLNGQMGGLTGSMG